MPQLDIDDEGYYRRLNIIPFDKKFSREEENNFDKEKLFTQDALDYLGNIALREYMKIMKTKVFANETESNDFIRMYRTTNNSVLTFLQDDGIIEEMFHSDDKVLKTTMYIKYVEYCKEYGFKIYRKKEFYENVLKQKQYIETSKNGYIFIKNLNIKKCDDKKVIVF